MYLHMQVRRPNEACMRVCVCVYVCILYRGADQSLARPGIEQATATEDFDVHISYLLP